MSTKLLMVVVASLAAGFLVGSLVSPFHRREPAPLAGLVDIPSGNNTLKHAGHAPSSDLLAIAESQNNTDERRGLFAAELKGKNEEELRTLLKDIAGRPPSLRLSELRVAIYKRWGEINPQAAIASANSMHGRERNACFVAVLDGSA
jgi:xanthosine utilization system XapX-like protein